MAATTLADKIAEAEAALQKLMTGSLREEVDYGGQRVRFFPTDVEKLRGYIEDLKAQLAGGRTRGAIGVQF